MDFPALSLQTIVFVLWVFTLAASGALLREIQIARQDTGRMRADLQHFEQMIADLHRERELLTNALIEARGEIERLRQDLQAARQQLAAWGFPADGGAWSLRNRTVLACVGADPHLLADEAALRAVEAATGLAFRRLRPATKGRLAAALDRARLHGHPYELVHLAVHAGPQGVDLDGELATGDWLSEHLQGVKVLLLAGCEGDALGDWLGAVPYAITISAPVSHEDAARLTQAFSTEIGRGMPPATALERALDRAPAGMREVVERNW